MSSSLWDQLTPVHKVLFPMPKPALYDHHTFGDELIYIPARVGGGGGDGSASSAGLDVAVDASVSSTSEAAQPIPCLWHPFGGPSIDTLIIFAHSNAADLGAMYHAVRFYSQAWRAHVLTYEFPGYGIYEGTPSEPALNHAAARVLAFVRDELEWPTDRIVLFGQSIGSGPTCHVAASLARLGVALGGVVLMSPFTSIAGVIEAHATPAVRLLANVVADRWPNLENIRALTQTPVLLLHGGRDTLVPAAHSQRLFDACPSPSKHVLISNAATHNAWNVEEDIVEPVRDFLRTYLSARSRRGSSTSTGTSSTRPGSRRLAVPEMPEICRVVPAIVKQRAREREEAAARARGGGPPVAADTLLRGGGGATENTAPNDQQAAGSLSSSSSSSSSADSGSWSAWGSSLLSKTLTYGQAFGSQAVVVGQAAASQAVAVGRVVGRAAAERTTVVAGVVAFKAKEAAVQAREGYTQARTAVQTRGLTAGLGYYERRDESDDGLDGDEAEASYEPSPDVTPNRGGTVQHYADEDVVATLCHFPKQEEEEAQASTASTATAAAASDHDVVATAAAVRR